MIPSTSEIFAYIETPTFNLNCVNHLILATTTTTTTATTTTATTSKIKTLQNRISSLSLPAQAKLNSISHSIIIRIFFQIEQVTSIDVMVLQRISSDPSKVAVL